MNPAFEGVEISGKQFPFVRVTIARQAEIIKKFKPTIIGVFAQSFSPERNNQRMWKKVRSVAFVKDWKWKYFRIIPKELRCSEIKIQQAGELQASFFSYVGEAVKGHDEPLRFVTLSKIGSEPTKSDG